MSENLKERKSITNFQPEITMGDGVDGIDSLKLPKSLKPSKKIISSYR